MKANQNTAWPVNISPHLQASYYLEARVGIDHNLPLYWVTCTMKLGVNQVNFG